MRHRVTLVLVLLASLLALPTAPALAEGPPGSEPAVSELTLSGPAAPLVGPEIGYLRVSVHLTAPSGVVQGTQPENPVPNDGYPSSPCPCVQLVSTARAGQGAGWLQVPLTLASGTTTDGMWVAAAPVTASQAGTWRVLRLAFANGLDHPLGRASQPEAVVLGSDPVELSVRPATRLPVPAGHPVVYVVTARLATSHRPVPNLRLGAFANIECANYEARSFVRTGADGTVRWAPRPASGFLVVWRPLAGAGTPGTIPPGEEICQASSPYSVTVTAVPAAAAVRAGVRDRVSGRISALCDPDVPPVLQRRVGRTWRTVNTKASVKGSGRIGAGCTYSLVANPPRGAHLYRVSLGASPYGRTATASRSFRLTGR